VRSETKFIAVTSVIQDYVPRAMEARESTSVGHGFPWLPDTSMNVKRLGSCN
jgi:hypothetical protein